MRRANTIVYKFILTLAKTAYRARVTVLAAFLGGLVVTDFCHGEETDAAGKPKAASQPAATPDPVKPAQTDAAPGEDHVRHHGALGVLLSKSQDGVMIVGVIPNSPAARAGLKLGDEVLYVGDIRIHTVPELTQSVSSFTPGTNLELLIRRSGKRRVVEANLADRDATAIKDGVGSAGPRAQSPAPAVAGAAAGPSREQQLNQRMRMLEKQIYQMQQSLNDLRYAHTVRAAQTYESNVGSAPISNGWYQQEQTGRADDDPDLFQ